MIKKEITEIKYNIINSLLAGGLTLLGALTTGNLTWTSVLIAIATAGCVGIAKFQKYWENIGKNGTSYNLFSFI